MMTLRFPLLLSTLLLAVVFAGCDSTGGDTITLETTKDGSTQLNPVFYTFRYDADNVENGVVKVVSEKNDDPNAFDSLDDLLERNGFSRNDVVSATVKQSVLIRRSSKSDIPRAKLFQYLDGGNVKVFLGESGSGTRFAEKQIQSTDKEISLDIVNGGDVTSAVKAGVSRAFLSLETSESVSGEDVVEVKVSYRVKVRGV